MHIKLVQFSPFLDRVCERHDARENARANETYVHCDHLDHWKRNASVKYAANLWHCSLITSFHSFIDSRLLPFHLQLMKCVYFRLSDSRQNVTQSTSPFINAWNCTIQLYLISSLIFRLSFNSSNANAVLCSISVSFSLALGATFEMEIWFFRIERWNAWMILGFKLHDRSNHHLVFVFRFSFLFFSSLHYYCCFGICSPSEIARDRVREWDMEKNVRKK